MENEKEELSGAIIAFSCSLILSIVSAVVLVCREVINSNAQEDLWYYIKYVLVHPHHMGVLIVVSFIGLIILILKKNLM